MRDVALEVGFTQAAIYYHFFQQDRLLQACGRPCDQAGDGQHRGRWCAFRTARLPRGCAASSAAFPPTTTAAFSFSACSSTRIARMRSASRSPPTTARSAGRRKPARRARALPPRARLPHRGARCGDARLSSDMNAMYAHYDAVLAGLRLRHAMSELCSSRSPKGKTRRLCSSGGISSLCPSSGIRRTQACVLMPRRGGFFWDSSGLADSSSAPLLDHSMTPEGITCRRRPEASRMAAASCARKQ